jgi:hypothetical protein
MKRPASSLLIAAIFLSLVRFASATATRTGASSQQWSDNDNWSPAAPQMSDDAIFGNSAQTSIEVDTQVVLN